MPQEAKEIIQFEHIDHDQVAEKQQAALRAKFQDNLTKQKAACKNRATLHGAIGGEEQQKRAESILEYQIEVEIELDVERKRRSRTRFARRRIHLKHINIEQPQRRRRWQRCKGSGDSVQVQAAEDTRAVENTE